MTCSRVPSSKIRRAAAFCTRCNGAIVCGVKLTHPFYMMNADIPAVVGIDLLAAAKLVIDVMNRCIYSHHHARLEVEPDTSDKEGGPVLCVDNATAFTASGITATPSATIVSDINSAVLTPEVSDSGSFPVSEVDVSSFPFSASLT